MVKKSINYHYRQSYNYQANFNIGFWRIDVRGAPDAGVGGLNVPSVTIGQICSMNML